MVQGFQNTLCNQMFNINKEWTLFLDRDGVINKRLPGRYVSNPGEFEFLEQVPEAIAEFSKKFGRIVVVTNQQGIGKGLMTEQQLATVHDFMQEGLNKAGGHLDAVYHCPDLHIHNPPNRKPSPGMGYLAKEEFPEIDFDKSIIAGDSLSDMLFGVNLGMKTVLIKTNSEEVDKVAKLEAEDASIQINLKVDGLIELAQLLAN